MATPARIGDVSIDIDDDLVATVEVHRPPNNHFDAALIGALADAMEALDADPACRAAVLCSEGRHFCAGADFGGTSGVGETEPGALYSNAVRLFAAGTPIVAVVQGAAVGGGLGLALAADFRVAAPEARFTANFARLGFHPGFGLTTTLPALVGQQHAADLLYTGRRVGGEEALAMGLCDRLAPLDRVRQAAHELAADIAQSAPRSISSIRRVLRGNLAERVRLATEAELATQDEQRQTADFREGVRAMAERRPPRFTGQ